MNIPIVIPLFFVPIYALIYALVTTFQMYHVYSFGIWDKVNIGVAAAFLIVSIILVAGMVVVIVLTDWTLPFGTFTLPSIPTGPTNAP